MKTIPTIISVAMLGSIACSQDADFSKSPFANIPTFPLRLTIRVTDEQSTPVQDAHVSVGFFDIKAKMTNTDPSKGSQTRRANSAQKPNAS